MKIFPSASGRTVWVKDTAANDIDAVTSHALGSVKRSRSVRLSNRRTSNGRTVWYEFRVVKL